MRERPPHTFDTHLHFLLLGSCIFASIHSVEGEIDRAPAQENDVNDNETTELLLRLDMLPIASSLDDSNQ